MACLYEVGFARSDSLRLYVASTVPVETLYLDVAAAIAARRRRVPPWARRGRDLRHQLSTALRRQQLYVPQQEYRAKHDALTGLLNREGFMQLLDQAIAECGRDSIGGRTAGSEPLQGHQ